MQFLFSKNMDPNLSKTVPGIPLRPLNHFLHIFEVRSILVKLVIFAIFDVQTVLSEKSTKEKISGRRLTFAHMRNVEKFINASDSYGWCLEIIRKQKVDLCYIISYPPPALQKRKDIHSDLFVNVFGYVFVFLLSLDPRHFTTIIQQHQRKKLALLQIPFKCKSHYSGDFPHRNACVDIRE